LQITTCTESSQVCMFNMKESTAARRIRSVRRHSAGSRRQEDRTDIVRLPPDRDVQLISEKQFEAVVRGLSRTETEEGTFYWRDGHPWQFARSGREVTLRNRRDHAPVRYYYIA